MVDTKRRCPRLTCLVLGVTRKLNDQGLVMLLSVSELRLHFPLVVVAEHLGALAVPDELLVVQLEVGYGLRVVFLPHGLQLEGRQAKQIRRSIRSSDAPPPSQCNQKGLVEKCLSLDGAGDNRCHRPIKI